VITWNYESYCDNFAIQKLQRKLKIVKQIIKRYYQKKYLNKSKAIEKSKKHLGERLDASRVLVLTGQDCLFHSSKHNLMSICYHYGVYVNSL